ncbi:MAG TPA: hypothetical protein VFD30_15155 [Terriglobia bacterium]|nr:hypothetical protein [Terriglobia bacterium]
MFIGHYGVALAAKRVAPKVSLGTLVLAAQLVDLIWPILLLLGIEHVCIDPGNMAATPLDFYDYPYTHSLAGAVGWAIGLASLYLVVRRYVCGAVVVGLCVVSHWFLDAIVHRPDLLIIPGGQTRIGLGVWNSLPAAMAVELGTLAIGLGIYVIATRARDRVGRWALWTLVVVLIGLWLGAILGPPPPSVKALAVMGLFGWAFVLWGYWIDRHRTPPHPDALLRVEGEQRLGSPPRQG